MFRPLPPLVGALLLLALAQTTQAQPVVRVNFDAVIVDLFDPQTFAPPAIDEGDTISGYFQYILGAPDTCVAADTGCYRYLALPAGLWMEVEGHTFETDSTAVDIRATVYDSFVGMGHIWDTFIYRSQYNTLDPEFLNVGAGLIFFEFRDSTGMALVSDSLPPVFPDVPSWTYEAFLRIYGEASYSIDADLISISVSSPPTGVQNSPTLPFRLGQNYPNPFSTSTTIFFSLDVSSHVQLVVYDVAGRRVTTLLDARLPAGEYQAPWEGVDRKSGSVATGIYFYVLSVDGTRTARRMVFLR